MSRSDDVQGIFGRDRPILDKMRAGTSPAEPEFFVVIQRTFWQHRNGRFSPNLVMKRSSVSRRKIRKDSFEDFHFRGQLPPKSEIENWQNRHLTQSRLQVMGCTAGRYCLLHVVVQGEFPRSVNFSLYGVRLRSNSCPIFGFWPIFAIQNP